MISKLKKNNISQQLILLSIVFFIGFGAQFLLNQSISTLTEKMDAKTQNVVTQGLLGEEIIRHIKKIELYFFQISAIKHAKYRTTIENKIRLETKAITDTLFLIENGGKFLFKKELNLPDKNNLERFLTYHPIKNSAFDILRIDITPKLILIQEKSAELNTLIDRLAGEQDFKKRMSLNSEIDAHIKQVSPLFVRLLENANRVIFDQQTYLLQLQKEVDSTKQTYSTFQFILTTILFMLGMILFFFIGKNIEHITEDLKTEKNKALAATRSKSAFLANMSHEIRTPLNAIMGFINILKSKPLDTESKHFLNTIDKASQNLLDIINDILDFSKIESNKLSIETISFSTKEVFFSTAELFQAKCTEKNLSLHIEIDQNIPPVLKSDPLRIKQIISNLLSNAIKFTEASKNIYLQIGFLNDENLLFISVKDEGIGIEKSKQNEIFKAFSQADSFTTRKYGGTGLGLAICSKLVDMLGGNIELESELNKGSNFYLKIPVEIGLSEDLKVQSITEEQSFNGHILLVEDNPTNQLLMTTILKKQNLTYDVANDGIEAIEAIREKHFDLILMDENMPNMNGIEATKRIRTYQQQTLQDPTPIIALTANAMKGDRQRFLEAGMDEYLTKPINMQNLFKILRTYLVEKQI